MLWIGERTRQLDGAHLEFLRGVGNPIGCKIGPDADGETVLGLCELLNPAQVPGRLTLITRMGADKVEDRLRPLLRGRPRQRASGGVGLRPHARQHVHVRHRPQDPPLRRHPDEIAGFVRAHRAEGTWPGGVHVELTGDDVTECLGGAEEVLDEHLDNRYETMCDPRLNGRQSLDLAFRVAELIPRDRAARGTAARRRLAGRARGRGRRRPRRPAGGAG